MAKDEGDSTAHSDGEGRQVDDVYLHEVGQRLIDLGEQLRVIGKHTENPKLRDSIALLNEVADDKLEESVELEVRDAVRRTLGTGELQEGLLELGAPCS